MLTNIHMMDKSTQELKNKLHSSATIYQVQKFQVNNRLKKVFEFVLKIDEAEIRLKREK